MFDHVTIRVTDRGASESFYDLVLGTIGIRNTYSGDDYAEWDDFSLGQTDEQPLTRRLHIGFAAATHELIDAFWQAGIDAGYESDGEPGPRPQYGERYYGGFLLDPDGNSAEAMTIGEEREGIDHLWIRVRDLEASQRFYETIAPYAGFRFNKVNGEPPRAQFLGDGGSFSIVLDGAPTENVHVAFPAGEDSTVDAFHAVALAAGYRDNGAPGERPVYHPGYYGAFVLDPDGNNVEVVNHNR